MLVSGFIKKLRLEFNDLPEKHREIKAGDNNSTVYKSLKSPVLEDSYGLYVNDLLQTEGISANYTLEKDTGDIVLGASTTNEIRFQYSSANFRDSHWLEFIQSAMYAMGDEFWKKTVRSTGDITLSANIQKYDCPSSCLRLTQFLESDDFTNTGNYVRPNVNYRYDRGSNTLILGNKPTRATYASIDFLRRLTIPTGQASVLDVEDRWLELLKEKVGAISHRALASKIAQQGNATIEAGHLSTSQLRQIANDHEIMYEKLKKRHKPPMPAFEIPFHLAKGGVA